ncbi:MAG: alpha/beta fold hydrolase [Gemmatimonadaceae bacterium]|nr:alpha/beta fold hydrolase [Gemmatimonadaceae bacterium]
MYTDHLYIPLAGSVQGRTLHVERTGYGGPAIVLLHGFGTSAFIWRQVVPLLAESGYTVVAIDLLGYGESQQAGELGTSPGDQAAHVELALTALRLGAVTVVGQGLGALVALLLASRAPERVARVALIEPSDPDALPGPSIRALQRTTAATALSANALFGARPLLEPFLQRAMPTGAPMEDRLVARHLAPFVGPDGAARLLQLASTVTLTEEQRSTFELLETDILLWYGKGKSGEAAGSGDGNSPNPVDYETRWRGRLPSCRLYPVVVDTPSGGLVPEIAPMALASAISDWIS